MALVAGRARCETQYLVTLNPILVLDRVTAEYRSYLRSEFRAKNRPPTIAIDIERHQARSGRLPRG